MTLITWRSQATGSMPLSLQLPIRLYTAPPPEGRFHTGYCLPPPSHCGSIRSVHPIVSAGMRTLSPYLSDATACPSVLYPVVQRLHQRYTSGFPDGQSRFCCYRRWMANVNIEDLTSGMCHFHKESCRVCIGLQDTAVVRQMLLWMDTFAVGRAGEPHRSRQSRTGVAIVKNIDPQPPVLVLP